MCKRMTFLNKKHIFCSFSVFFGENSNMYESLIVKLGQYFSIKKDRKRTKKYDFCPKMSLFCTLNIDNFSKVVSVTYGEFDQNYLKT